MFLPASRIFEKLKQNAIHNLFLRRFPPQLIERRNTHWSNDSIDQQKNTTLITNESANIRGLLQIAKQIAFMSSGNKERNSSCAKTGDLWKGMIQFQPRESESESENREEAHLRHE